MIDDEKLMKISYEIDDFLLEQLKSNEISPLNLTSIILARLVLLNKDGSSMIDFYRLLESLTAKNYFQSEKNKTLQ